MLFDLRHQIHPAAVALMLAVIATGCVHEPQHPSAAITQHPIVVRQQHQDPVLALLDYAHKLHSAGPTERADHVVAARRAVKDNAGAQSCARLALAYGTPDQRRYTPDEAARYAQRALDADDAHWSPAAQQYLSDYARLYETVASAQESALASTSATQDDPDDRHADVRAHIARLQAELDEAHRKLRELVHIEDRLSDIQP